MRYDIFDPPGLVVVCFSGILSQEDMRQHVDSVLADPRHRAGMNNLVDWRLVTNFLLTPEEERLIAQRIHETAAFWGQSRYAMVAASDFLYGMARLYGAYVELGKTRSPCALDMHVFRGLTEAMDWLGLDDESFRAVLAAKFG